MKTVFLKCENCDAYMEPIPGKRMIYCPYCGAKALIEETDSVKIAGFAARIESERTKQEKEKTEQQRIALERDEEVKPLASPKYIFISAIIILLPLILLLLSEIILEFIK